MVAILKLLSLFSGIGSFEKALNRQNINYELVNYCEIDKYASVAYAAIHNVNESKNLGDITKINIKELSDFDMMTYGFPCQDISIAGNQIGFKREDNTRSSLLWEAMTIAKQKQPKIMIAENVKNLVGKKFRNDFDQWLKYLKSIGYNNYWNILNSKDYGIPQNRERVFIISVSNKINYNYNFPKKYNHMLELKNIIEDEVDDKYYLSENVTNRLINIYNQEKGHKPTFINKYEDIYCPTITTRIANGGNWETYIIKGCSLRTRKYKNLPQRLEIRKDNLCNSITTIYKDAMITNFESIRKLTPLECFRLMGFDDKDYYKLKANNIPDSQLYKMAGNSIVVNVLEAIYKELFKEVLLENIV